MRKFFLFSLLMICVVYFAESQTEKVKGTVVKDYGPTYPVVNPDIKVDPNTKYKLILDVASSSHDRSEVNKSIATAARFLNMHAGAGVPVKNLEVAVVIHGGAWQDILTNEAYKEKFGVENPNLLLIEELVNAGGEVIICGQTAAKRQITKANADKNIKFALSAMTTFLQYENNGFTYLKL